MQIISSRSPWLVIRTMTDVIGRAFYGSKQLICHFRRRVLCEELTKLLAIRRAESTRPTNASQENIIGCVLRNVLSYAIFSSACVRMIIRGFSFENASLL